MLRTLLFSALALSCAFPLEAAPRSDAARAVEPFIHDRTLAGAVVLVADRDRILSLDALGDANLADHTRMERDELFWIRELSKLLQKP